MAFHRSTEKYRVFFISSQARFKDKWFPVFYLISPEVCMIAITVILFKGEENETQ